MKDDKVINQFLLKEEGNSVNIVTDGNTLIYYGTCLAQWKGSSILLNNTFYNADINNMESFILHKVRNSMLLFKNVSKEVPIDSKNILAYE